MIQYAMKVDINKLEVNITNLKKSIYTYRYSMENIVNNVALCISKLLKSRS